MPGRLAVERAPVVATRTPPARRYFAVLLLIIAGMYALIFFTGTVRTPQLGLDLRGGTTVTLTAKTPDYAEPVAWARDAKPGERGRVFYTSLGVPKDFEDPQFQVLLANAVAWTAKLEVPPGGVPSSTPTKMDLDNLIKETLRVQ